VLLNNLEIKKCLYLVLAVILVMAGLVILSASGSDVPVLRQIVGFIFLTLIPGTLILRILKIHNISAVESLVYTVGLSLAFVMFAGLFANTVLPLFGISKPISLYPLMVTLCSLVLILAFLTYQRDKRYAATPGHTTLQSVFSPPSLLLFLLLLLAILGALLVSSYQNNVMLLVFILAVAAIIGFTTFGKFIPEAVYPLAIVIIALALLYHTEITLASPFLSGYDIRWELKYQNFVAQSGYWDPAIGGSLNTSLSIVMLSPIYSLILGMDAIWIFKIIYPLFFCLVPLALFHVFRQQIGGKRAFLSVFFFMSVMYFFGLGNRQQIAELFFALLILLMIDKKMILMQKSVLAIIFVISLPLSHYGLAYVGLAYFIIGWLLLTLMNNSAVINLWEKITGRLRAPPAGLREASSIPERVSYLSVLSGTLVILYIVFTLTWYMYISSGTPFHALVTIGQNIYSNLTEFANPVARESLVATATGLDFPSASSLGRAFRVLQLTTQLLIIAGFIRLFFRPESFKFRAEYIALTVVSTLILFACIVIPYFSGILEVERFYHITLFLLAPLCILGGEPIYEGMYKLFRRFLSRLKLKRALLSQTYTSDTALTYYRVLALVVLIPYFLFNTGFIFEVSKSERYNVVDIPSAEALSSYRMDMKTMNDREYAAQEWLTEVIDDYAWILADQYGKLHRSPALFGRISAFRPEDAQESGTEPTAVNAYIYLRTHNLTTNEAVFMFQDGTRIRFGHLHFDDLPNLSRLINSKNLVYSNGGAHLLAP